MLLSIVARELLLGYRRNLVALFLFANFLILYQSQAWYMLPDFEGEQTVRYFDNIISPGGFRLANVTMTASVAVISLIYLFGSGRKVIWSTDTPAGLSEPPASYLVILAVQLLAALLMSHLFGGFGNLFHALGSMQGGQVATILLLWLAKMPLFHKIAYGHRRTPLDWAMLLFSLFLILLNSRGLVLLVLFQYMFLRHYCTRDFRYSRMVMGTLVAVFIVFVYGSLRDYINHGFDYDLETMQQFFLDPSGGLRFDVLELFFTASIGTFSGFAGIMSAWLRGPIDYDFGVTNLALFVHLLPFVVREALIPGMNEWFGDVYPYKGSIVPGGYEAAFAHFSFAGIVALSVAIGWAAVWPHRKLASGRCDRLKYGMLTVYTLHLLSNDVWIGAFYALGDVTLLAFYRFILRTTAPAHHAILIPNTLDA